MQKQGLIYAFSAYTLWGLFPLYWAYLKHINSVEVLLHRMAWAAIFVSFLVSATCGWQWLKPALRSKKILATTFVAAITISLNWGIYIYAVANNQIVDASLGYYINPLVSVLCGVIFFKESLRPMQWFAVFIAACGVAYMVLALGQLPWISLVLALSFSVYGVIKKSAPLGAFEGMALETGLLFLPATACLIYWSYTGQGVFGQQALALDALLVLSGVLTLIPLLFFAAATSKLPLSLIGVIQYLAPTLQLMVGVLILGEPFSNIEQVGFGIIWVALIIFAFDSLLLARKTNR